LTGEPVDLDDLGAIARLDSLDVLGTIENFAGQCRSAWDIGVEARDLPAAEGVDAIVVLGMGGSGVSGDIMQAVVEPRFHFPVRVIKDYGPLPAWVGRNTLVFSVSYSGNTEETLAATQEAHDRGARVVAISAGGRLGDVAAGYGIAHVTIPSGFQPRASLGYLALPILAVLQEMGFLVRMKDDVDETIEILERQGKLCHRSRSVADNPAKSLARKLDGKVAVAYGTPGLMATAAMRFKCDLNEYAKVPAFWNFLPEADHNEVEAWGGGAEVVAGQLVAVMLRDPEEHHRNSLRFEVTKRLISSHGAGVIELWPEGTSDLARLISMIFVTQLASIYVGLARGVDPGPVEVLERLKSQLAQET
jgi:glucose/mannose-6-phosphate isomerase